MIIDLDYDSLRKRAEQCRLLASRMRDKNIRDQLIGIAMDYDAWAIQYRNKRPPTVKSPAPIQRIPVC